MENKFNQLDIIMNGLMSRYKKRVPCVNGVVKAMIKEGMISSIEDIENDSYCFSYYGR